MPRVLLRLFYTFRLATIEYLVDAPYDPENQRCLIWNDPLIAIDWPEKIEPILSNKDANGLCFTSIKRFCNWEVAAISEIEKFNLGAVIKRFSDNFNIS